MPLLQQTAEEQSQKAADKDGGGIDDGFAVAPAVGAAFVRGFSAKTRSKTRGFLDVAVYDCQRRVAGFKFCDKHFRGITL